MKGLVPPDPVCALLLLLSVFCFFTAAVSLVRMRRFSARARAAQGKVVRSYPVTDGTSNPTYAAVVEFTAAGGKTVEYTKRTRSALEPVMGTAVRLLYDPDNPAEVKLGSRTGLYAEPCLLFLVGAAFAVAGYLMCGFDLAR